MLKSNLYILVDNFYIIKDSCSSTITADCLLKDIAFQLPFLCPEFSKSQNHPSAICALGWVAMEIEKNYSRAARLFQQSYSLDFPDSGYYLGHMYQHGLYPNHSRDEVRVKGTGQVNTTSFWSIRSIF